MNNQQQQMGTGLARYRSAPSSYFSSFLNSNTFGGFGTDHDFEQLFNPSPNSTAAVSNSVVQETVVSVPKLSSPRLPPKPKLHRHRSNDYSSAMYNKTTGTSDSKPRNSGLIRQSSSPAGLFDNINIGKDFGGLTGMGNFGVSNCNAERVTNRRSSGMMTPISEIGTDEGIGETNPGIKKDEDDYLGDFPMNSWDDSSLLSDNFLKELADQSDAKPFPNANASDVQKEEGGNQATTALSRHLSLPTSSAELSAMEKLLHDTVPFKIRAKRGCATHPRSIAERVRRTKISDRIRKLQELVPNMEKQTNTSDMLDLAVDYIKDLQTQVKKLSDARARCCCLARQRL